MKRRPWMLFYRPMVGRRLGPPDRGVSGAKAGNDGAASSDGNYREFWSKRLTIGIIILMTKDFIVHIKEDHQIEWSTTEAFDAAMLAEKRYDQKLHNRMLNDCTVLEAMPSEGFNHATRLNFLRLIGEATARAFEFDYAGAKSMLQSARKYFEDRSEEASRSWYLRAAALSCLPFCALVAILWLGRNYWNDQILGDTAFWLLLSACAGSVGALFSVMTRTGKMKCDSSAGKELHCLEACSRVVTGAVGGFVVALAVKTGWILGPLVGKEHLHTVMILVAIAGGVSERFATSIISKMEASGTKTGSKPSE